MSITSKSNWMISPLSKLNVGVWGEGNPVLKTFLKNVSYFNQFRSNFTYLLFPEQLLYAKRFSGQ